MTLLPRREPPAGEPLRPHLTRSADAAGLASELARGLAAQRVDLVASGREALRIALEALAQQDGRREVVVPAYTCPSVAAAAVAAGLRVRLVAVTSEGRLDPLDLARLPLERAVAVVVCNLFGIPEPIGAIRRITRQAGVALVDDAAQAFGAADASGPVGGRGDVGVLSFARGKPLGALGGGALAWCRPPLAAPPPAPPAAGPGRVAMAVRLHDLALHPGAFPWIERIPWLHVGETRFEPRFRRGGIDAAAAQLVAGLLAAHPARMRVRAGRLARLVLRLARESGFEALGPRPGASWAPPRLVLRAPGAGLRRRALRSLAPRGARPFYPLSLDALAALDPHRADGGSRVPEPRFAPARRLAERLLTLPPTLPCEGPRADELVATLRALAPAPRGRRAAL